MIMKLERNKPMRLQTQDGSLIPLAQAEVERDVECSYLRSLIDEEGNPVRLQPGATVTLLSGESVLFVGVVQPDFSVKDFLSCRAEDGEYEDL